MRSIPSDIASKLALTKQTKANKADPSASIWIGRPTTALTTDAFLERQTVLTAPVTDTSVAVCHPRAGRNNTYIYMAYVSNGVAKVKRALAKSKMSSHVWVDCIFSESASAVSIAFDGIMPKKVDGTVEFITETDPWIFWVNADSLYTRKLGTSTTITLAEQNCTDVSAVRAPWSDVASFDFGLCCFFILSGAVYYRQYINGEWCDAAQVPPTLPQTNTYVEIAASRTWDYRVALQAITSDGAIIEAFTQFGGIGSRNQEHISVDVDADSTLTEVTYFNTKLNEHVEVDVSAEGELIYGLSSVPITVGNIANDSDDWGFLVTITLDYPVTNVSGNLGFVLSDVNGTTYNAISITSSTDGLILTVEFPDFNNAYGECSITYTPGTIQSPATAMLGFTKSFTPQNLVPVQIDPPAVASIINT